MKLILLYSKITLGYITKKQSYTANKVKKNKINKRNQLLFKHKRINLAKSLLINII